MAISTYKVFLMKKGDGSTYSKLVDIKSFPDLGGTPELLDTTTLSNKMRTGIPGIQDQDTLSFTCNYTKAEYTTLAALADTENDYAVWFGGTESGGVVTPDGSDGKFAFKGYLTVHVVGGGVNEVVDMQVDIIASSDISAS